MQNRILAIFRISNQKFVALVTVRQPTPAWESERNFATWLLILIKTDAKSYEAFEKLLSTKDKLIVNKID